ncbi:Nn.00g059480.m01.CDS01 [Neocucurbitaria sp. VM-36]
MDYLSNIFPDQDEPCYERSQSTTQSDLNASVHPTADTDSSGAMGTDSVVASWPNSETNLYLPLSTYTDEMSSEVAGNRCAGPSSTSLQDFTQDSSLSDLLEHSREPNADLLSFGLQELDASTNNNLLHVLPNISLSELQENLRSYEVFDAQHQKRPGIGTMEDDLPSQIQAIQGYGSLDVMGPQASANDLFPHDSIPVDMDWVMDDSFSCFHHTPSNMDVLRSNKPNLPMSIFESPGSAHPSPDRASDGGVSRHYGPEDRRHTATGDNIVVHAALFHYYRVATVDEKVRSPLSTKREVKRHETMEFAFDVAYTGKGVLVDFLASFATQSRRLLAGNIHASEQISLTLLRTAHISAIIERQFSSILRIAKEEQSGKFTLCVPGLMGIEGIINWYVILWILAEIIRECNHDKKGSLSSHQLYKVRMNGESRPEIAIAAFTERRNRIRSALHCYLQMAVSQLPAFSDFWKVRSDCLLPMPSDTWKVVLDDISILDSQISDSVSTAMSYMECYKDWYNSPNMGIVPSLGDLALKDVDTTEAVRLAQEILTGSVFQATIKETLTILSGRIEVAFLAARDAFETLGLSSIVGTCQDTIIELERIQVDLRHCLAELEKNPRNLDQIKRSGDSVRIADQNMETWVDELRSYMEILKGVTEREDLGHDSD